MTLGSGGERKDIGRYQVSWAGCIIFKLSLAAHNIINRETEAQARRRRCSTFDADKQSENMEQVEADKDKDKDKDKIILKTSLCHYSHHMQSCRATKYLITIRLHYGER